ncbi:MAG TPA: hypothetical protein VN437_02195, partial [Rectinemataceae bacterium]|nr:hypothetical protein [Rectinemataceae bacterium]
MLMANARDVQIRGLSLYYLAVKTRIPLKFGPETTTHATCARVRLSVESRDGRRAEGWGETPLSVAWVWPSELSYETRLIAMQEFCLLLAKEWKDLDIWGHPMEIGQIFLHEHLPALSAAYNARRIASGQQPMPKLAFLVCSASFDLALFDAYGNLHGLPSFDTLNAKFMNQDLSWFYGTDYDVIFRNRYPEDFLVRPTPLSLPAWHLVGGKDILSAAELTGSEPNDGYPVLLPDWIKRDGLKCLKIKLTGMDQEWDYNRILRVGKIAIEGGVDWLSADFNCTVHDPSYVNQVLDRLLREAPRTYGMLLYIEQPFPYDLENNRIDVHSLSARKPLFMDESAHDWK